MADEHETESQAWAIEAAAAEAASRAAEEVHRPPVVPMERVVDRTDIERGERAGQKRSQEPGFPRFFAELNLGLILTAFAIVAFKTPNHFAFGGTSGMSVILSTLFPTLPVGVFMWIINAVLVVLGFIFLERKAILWSVFASFALSAYVSLFELFIPTDVSLKGDMWLDLCFAVILPARGSAIVFDIGASTGGTDIVAMIINKYRTVSYGKILIYSDFVIIGSALLVGMGSSAVIYGYVMTAVVGYTVDMIMAGNQQSSQVFIVTHDYEKLAQAIVDNVHRGVTLIDSQGWYSKKESKIVMVVCRKRETSMILKFVKTIDPEAFMTVGSVMGVYGKGFQTIGKG